ncbi:MAG: VOC family protein [Planctomycetaceae bacterium]
MKLMKSRSLAVFNVFAVCGVALAVLSGAVQDAERRFSDTTVDLGIVVSDLDRSLKFYTTVVGLTHDSEFFVDENFCRDAGLTDGHGLKIQVLHPNGDVDGTGIKLMQLNGVNSAKADHGFIHSTLGYSYLTFHVADIDAASARLKAAGIKPVGKDQVRVPLETPEPIYLTVIADPDGNLIELLGPRGAK